MTAKNAICIWDFTVKSEGTTQEEIKTWCKENCKSWCFQEELGKTGYQHFQGKISLKTKSRNMCGKLSKETHWSPSCSETLDYVTKEDTRVDGPWSDKTDVYIPRQIRGIILKPWQQQVVDISKEFDTRHINMIIDHVGGIGKSTLVTYMGVHGYGSKLPYCNDYKDIMRMAYSLGPKQCYIIDMPRAINKERLYQMYAAIEELKGGYSFDDRYHFECRYFDCPCIWVFSNKMPDKELLSKDRWRIFTVEPEDSTLLKMAPSA